MSRSPKASRSGTSGDQIECEWKGVFILYNGWPHDLFDLSLELGSQSSPVAP
jgi:hypothetical protein